MHALAWMLLALQGPARPARRDYSLVKPSGQKKFYDFFCKKLLPEAGQFCELSPSIKGRPRE